MIAVMMMVMTGPKAKAFAESHHDVNIPSAHPSKPK